MQSQEANNVGYKIWAVDGVVYGPVDFCTLLEWAKDERVLADTWIYVEAKDAWQKAAQVDGLFEFFKANSGTSFMARPVEGYSMGCLRRIKILGGLSDQQIDRFAKLMEVQLVRQFEKIFKQGEPSDAMYMVLEGELRASMNVSGRETLLATLGAGDFFGEMALFDSGPRSADVIANRDSTLLKVSLAKFERLQSRAPELAAPILQAIGKTLVARIRADNKRLKDAVAFARASGI